MAQLCKLPYRDVWVVVVLDMQAVEGHEGDATGYFLLVHERQDARHGLVRVHDNIKQAAQRQVRNLYQDSFTECPRP